MIATLHLCGPQGEALRQQLCDMLNMVKRDNRYVINAMLHSGMDVPDTVIDAGLEYVPSRHEKAVNGEPLQSYYGMRAMFESGTFSCFEGASYEAAVAEEKYGVPTECVAVAFGDEDFHGIYVTPDEVIDPTENYLQHWEEQFGFRTATPRSKKPRRNYGAKDLSASCRIVEGRVDCDVRDSRGCVDLKRRRWNSSDPSLSGKRVTVAEVFTGSNSQRWAKTKDGVYVPVCGGL